MAPYTDFTMFRYAITSRALYPGDEQERQTALLKEASRWIAQGIEFIQLREKDLGSAGLARLAGKILRKIDLARSSTRLLINSRPDVAIAKGAQGVHLSSHRDELTPNQIRSLFAAVESPAPLITVSCHSLTEIELAHQNQVDAILFAPVFEKLITGESALAGQGLKSLSAACIAAGTTPVYALGGVTFQNADSCLESGAAGIAGIRLFHSG